MTTPTNNDGFGCELLSSMLPTAPNGDPKGFLFPHNTSGTLFMDEVGERPIALQPKLLRVLQDGEFECADLYCRLNVFPIALSALRERRDDLPALVGHFVRRFAERYGKPLETVSPVFMAALETHDWPGNVRELEHVIERAVILSHGAELTFDKARSVPIKEGDPEPETLAEAERAHILRVLEAARWRVAGPNGAAERLGLSRRPWNRG